MKSVPLFLVVEDSEDFRSLLEYSYQENELSCRLIFADSAEEALDYLENSLFQSDVVLLDYNLPGMNGLAFAQEIRSQERWKLLPIVMVSFYANPELINQAYEKGINSFITKPEGYTPLLELWKSVFAYWKLSQCRSLVTPT